MYILEIKIDDSVSNIVKEYYNQLQNRDSSDSGIDLVAIEDISVKPLQVGTIDFKIKCQMINIITTATFGEKGELDDSKYYPYYLYPRSSISKTPLGMANSIGIIDKDYRGNIMAKVRNFSIDDTYNITSGDRLFQICAPDLSPIKIMIVSTLTETSRGEGGFGSTGKTLQHV
jgi:dUTP pyrophosphatase|uniref:dUTP diphosphatase n=1 Tax=viral metagenome TaxID=1070528 RepID=A0A6C0IV63_9ZZZZ